MCAFFLSNDVNYILNRLESAGHRADIVGGPVRDLIRGAVPYDFDITTSALPEETKAVFEGERVIETGIKHGTVTLLLNGQQYEITTYRIDGEYEDSRHPKSVSFTKRIEDDLARRDFTVNAIAYSEKHGITDPFGGAIDIEKKIIRAVGRAEDRFDEDALRIIRGIRFASTLGFSVEEKTKSAMKKKAHLLDKISKERIFVEWKKLLMGEAALSILQEYSAVTEVFLPEALIPTGINKTAFYQASMEARHISLFASSDAEKYRSAMQRLKTDRHILDTGFSVLSSIGKYKRDRVSLAFMLRDIGVRNARYLIECEAILGMGNISDIELLQAVIDSGAPYELSMLNISGANLLDIGFIGAEIKETLLWLQEKVLIGELDNRYSSLIKSAAVRKD